MAQKYCKECAPIRKHSRDKQCEWCGESFHDNSKNNSQKYCGKQCRHLARNYQAADWQSRYYMKKREVMYDK